MSDSLAISPMNSAASGVVIKTRENGPFLVTGPVTLTDHLGNVYHTNPGATIALCRCGASQKRPFCDGSHRGCNFVAGELAPPPEPTPAPTP